MYKACLDRKCNNNNKKKTKKRCANPGQNAASATFDALRVYKGKSVREEVKVFVNELLILADKKDFDDIEKAYQLEAVFQKILPIVATYHVQLNQGVGLVMKNPTKVERLVSLQDIDFDDL